MSVHHGMFVATKTKYQSISRHIYIHIYIYINQSSGRLTAIRQAVALPLQGSYMEAIALPLIIYEGGEGMVELQGE